MSEPLHITDSNAAEVCYLLGEYLEETFGDNWYARLSTMAERIAEELETVTEDQTWLDGME